MNLLLSIVLAGSFFTFTFLSANPAFGREVIDCRNAAPSEMLNSWPTQRLCELVIHCEGQADLVEVLEAQAQINASRLGLNWEMAAKIRSNAQRLVSLVEGRGQSCAITSYSR